MVQPEFKRDNKIFTNALLIHRVLVEGQGEELLKVTQQFSKSILHHACEYVVDSDEDIEVNTSADMSAVDKKQLTPLMIATDLVIPNSVVISLLIEKAANAINVLTGGYAKYLLRLAAEHASGEVIKMVKAKTENAQDDDLNKELLFNAAKFNTSGEIVRMHFKAYNTKISFLAPLEKFFFQRSLADFPLRGGGGETPLAEKIR